jgi:excisionase family DNA binding protein
MGKNTNQPLPRSELELLTEAEFARLLKVCRRQLYKWRVAGVIPSFKPGRAVRIWDLGLGLVCCVSRRDGNGGGIVLASGL